MTVAILLMALIAPGLLHARTAPVRHSAPASVSAVSLAGALSSQVHSVWNLLTNLLKTGSQLDPSGTKPPGTSSTTGTGDTGSQLDPSGTPH